MVNSISYESKGKERKDLIIKHTTTTTTRIKPVIFVVISLLAIALIYSSSASYVFAEPPDPCWGDDCAGTKCEPFGSNGTDCCWDGPNGQWICQTCYNTDDGTIAGCDPPRTKGRPDSSTIAPPPSGVAPPPSTNTCPDNTALDANGNCAPVTQGPKESPSICPDNTALDANGNCAPVTQGPKESPSKDQGTTQPPSTDDNKPSKHKLPKSDILKLQP
jgi:hypothetical protein